ncbi:hypothetical protein BDN72DRAFT_940463 [Pluteus cervinus]|uniref:Uncharacterized protein n=1 Tax=Pluteus cervinus TaxID=181527 RepID=A0ACD3A3Q8_9AGAR|nr:hypothetical protein BDN72DRAFT_940463 [Pluteus cervinus]
METYQNGKSDKTWLVVDEEFIAPEPVYGSIQLLQSVVQWRNIARQPEVFGSSPETCRIAGCRAVDVNEGDRSRGRKSDAHWVGELRSSLQPRCLGVFSGARGFIPSPQVQFLAQDVSVAVEWTASMHMYWLAPFRLIIEVREQSHQVVEITKSRKTLLKWMEVHQGIE